MSLADCAEWWERPPNYVERACADCGRSFTKNARASKQVCCSDCAKLRAKERQRAQFAKWYAKWRVSPCRSRSNEYRREKARLTREAKRLESPAAVNPNKES